MERLARLAEAAAKTATFKPLNFHRKPGVASAGSKSFQKKADMIDIALRAPLRNFISPSTEYSKSIIEFPASPAMPQQTPDDFSAVVTSLTRGLLIFSRGLAGLGIEEARQ